MSTSRRTRAIVVVVVLLGAVTALIVYLQSHQAKGTAAMGNTPPAECRLDEQTLRRAHTSNLLRSTKSDSAQLTYTSCDWTQTKGEDGIDTRDLGVQIHRYTTEKDAKDGFANGKAKPHSVQPADTTDATGIGDQAAYQTAVGSSGLTSVTLVARSATTVIEVTYRGSDQGWFWTTPMSADEGKDVTKIVAAELLSRP